jgi:DNA-binding transcriptional ArsR family regulator
MAGKLEFSKEVKEIARISKALSHPARVFILQKLSKMNSCCYSGDLVEEIPIARSTLSEHLKELKYAGLIQGEINPPYIKYCINRENWEKARKLMDDFLNDNQSADFSCDEKKHSFIHNSITINSV